MKKHSGYSRTDKIILILAFLGMLFSGALFFQADLLNRFTAQDDVDAIGVIERFSKDVRRKNQKTVSWTAARDNDAIAYGDSIFTGANSTAKVKLVDGSEVNVVANSLVVFKPANNGQASIDLQFGEVVSKVAANSTLKLKLNGKVVELTSNEDTMIKMTSEGKIKVLSGQVSVKSENKIQTSVSKDGQELQELTITEAASDSPNTAAQIASRAPAMDDSQLSAVITPPVSEKVEELSLPPTADVNNMAIDLVEDKILHRVPSSFNPILRWRSSIPWKEFKVEYSTDEKFTSKQEFPAADNSFELSDTAMGKYFFRIIATKNGEPVGTYSNLGQLLVRSNVVEIEKPAPVIVESKDGKSKARPIATQVKWTPIEHVDQYEVEISKDKKFSKKETQISRGPASSVTMENPGDYYVRVRPLDSEGKPLAAFSSTENLKYIYKAPIATPLLMGPVADSTLFFQKQKNMPLWFEWENIDIANNYVLQISKNPDFDENVYEFQSKTNRYLINKRLPAGELYWRVKANTETKQSDWSAPHKFKIITGRAR